VSDDSSDAYAFLSELVAALNECRRDINELARRLDRMQTAYLVEGLHFEQILQQPPGIDLDDEIPDAVGTSEDDSTPSHPAPQSTLNSDVRWQNRLE
jgi:hypothetical protein